MPRHGRSPAHKAERPSPLRRGGPSEQPERRPWKPPFGQLVEQCRANPLSRAQMVQSDDVLRSLIDHTASDPRALELAVELLTDNNCRARFAHCGITAFIARVATDSTQQNSTVNKALVGLCKIAGADAPGVLATLGTDALLALLKAENKAVRKQTLRLVWDMALDTPTALELSRSGTLVAELIAVAGSLSDEHRKYALEALLCVVATDGVQEDVLPPHFVVSLIPRLTTGCSSLELNAISGLVQYAASCPAHREALQREPTRTALRKALAAVIANPSVEDETRICCCLAAAQVLSEVPREGGSEDETTRWISDEFGGRHFPAMLHAQCLGVEYLSSLWSCEPDCLVAAAMAVPAAAMATSSIPPSERETLLQCQFSKQEARKAVCALFQCYPSRKGCGD